VKVRRGSAKLGVALALALAATSCGSRAKDEAPAVAPPVTTGSAAAVVPPATGPSRRAKPEAPPVAVADEEPLVEEAPEANPRSETVTIKLVAEPARKARVFWGRKDLGLAPLELQRPRGSGPLDLLVVAPGALPLHTRVFTDRDDKLALRLYAESEAPALLGYHPPDPSTSPKTAPDIAKAKGGTRH
jgi:hypothetical protein